MSASGLRERKKDRTRATITRVALELFARDGFAATTLNAIAEAADVSPRTVSTYFPSKEGIVFGGYQPAIERLRARLEQRTAGQPIVEVIREWLETESKQPAETTSAMVRQLEPGEVDFARLRAAAIARDPELWALQRRQAHAVQDLIAAAAADELGQDGLAARLVGATTVAALLELNAYVAGDGGGTTAGSLELVLQYLRAGVAAVQK
jgi:AcrR family transcriptional regulator